MRLHCTQCNAKVSGSKADIGRSCKYCEGHFEVSRVKLIDPDELDLTPYFVEGEWEAAIPVELELDGKDLRAFGRGIWSVGVNAAGERRAAMDCRFLPSDPAYKGEGFQCIWLR